MAIHELPNFLQNTKNVLIYFSNIAYNLKSTNMSNGVIPRNLVPIKLNEITVL